MEAKRAWDWIWIERVAGFGRDIRYALRLLWRSPAYALAIVAVLALGIGTNVIAFALFQAMALTPLPGVARSTELQVLMARTTSGRTVPLSYPDYVDLRAQSRVYTGLAAATMQGYTLGRGAEVEQLFGELVSGNYFEVLGVDAQVGRTILPSDETAIGRHPVVVVGDDLWRRRFAADPAIVGKSIFINGYPLTVVGVAAPAFRGSVVGVSNDVFIPIMMQPQVSGCLCNILEDRKGSLFVALGRLRRDVSVGQARAEADVLSSRLSAEHPLDTIDRRAILFELWESPFGAQTYLLPAVSLMGAMGGLLLLVVCANVAGLVLVRGISRRGEIAARLALGASRARIMRMLLAENLVLAVPGAIVAIYLPALAEPFLRGAESGMTLPLYFNMEGSIVPVFALVVACVSAVTSGFLPGLAAARIDLVSVMKDSVSPRGARKARLRTALVLSQVAMSVLLLVGTGLVVRSLHAARRVDAGFDPANVAWAAVDVKLSGYDEPRGRAFYRQLLDRARERPGVESAGLATYLPVTLIDMDVTAIEVEGYEQRRDEDVQFLSNVVSPGYLETVRIGLVSGRDFRREDEAGPGVAIVNEAFARRFWGSPASAIGKRLRAQAWERGTIEWRTVVGVARNAKYTSLTEDPRPYVYTLFPQIYNSRMLLHVRGAGAPARIEDLRSLVRDMDPNLAVLDSRMLTEQIQIGVSIFDLTARVLAIVGAVAMALAALGIYGLVAYTVKQRTKEIGIRVALGARRSGIVRHFLTAGLALGVIGAAIGVAVALIATRLMASFLFGVSATDSLSFVSAVAIVVAVALVASLVPAWIGARIDPIDALRRS
jgi:predicted permease